MFERVVSYVALVASVSLGCTDESPTTGGPGASGSPASGGSNVSGSSTSGGSAPTAGSSSGGTSSAGSGNGSGNGGRDAGGGAGAASAGAGGSVGQSGSGGGGGSAGSGAAGGASGSCVPTKAWGTADPSAAGPFEVLVEKDVGPENGEPDALHDNMKPHFNIYRPKDLEQGYCHPVITWGNGTNDQPEPNPPACASGCGNYKVLMNQLASHGFVVVASLSSQTAKGNPLPQVAGVDWMISENENPASALYHRLDVAHIGATGHSQGGAATTMSGADPRIVAIAPLCGSRANITLHGPALLLCGGADDIVKCSSVQTAYDSIGTVPVMLAELAGMTHGSWIGSIKDPAMVGITAWMRVHLMNDTANRSMFYGAGCKTCSDAKWKVQRKMMD